MFATLLRRAAREPLSKVTSQAAGASSTLGSSSSSRAAATPNPFQARKVWPPNLKELTPQQQLRFEKKYKRRVINAQKSPRWHKAVTYAQFATLTGKQEESWHPSPVRGASLEGKRVTDVVALGGGFL